MKHSVIRLAALSFCVSLASATAFGSGFEKSVGFSGKYGGIAGAGASTAEGPESLYFNPAALSSSAEGVGIVLGVSPVISQFKGAINDGDDQLTAEQGFSTPIGVFAGYKLGDKMGVGLGFYTAGGALSEYEDVDVTLFDDGVLKTDLAINEASLGLGYEVTDGLSIGASYRLALVAAELSTIKTGTSPVSNAAQINFTDLTATGSGFKFGVLYAPKDSNWGIGATFRSKIDFTAEGKVGGKLKAAAAFCNTGDGCEYDSDDATLSSTFPIQINVGTFYNISPELKVILEYGYTQYADNKEIALTGELDGTGVPAATDLADSPLNLGWNNQHQGKLAFAYTGMPEWTWRLGYNLVGQVVPAGNASPTFSAPGTAHVIALGAGHRFGSVGVDLAYEFTTLSGEGAGANSGDYSQTAHTLHTGVAFSL